MFIRVSAMLHAKAAPAAPAPMIRTSTGSSDMAGSESVSTAARRVRIRRLRERRRHLISVGFVVEDRARLEPRRGAVDGLPAGPVAVLDLHRDRLVQARQVGQLEVLATSRELDLRLADGARLE